MNSEPPSVRNGWWRGAPWALAFVIGAAPVAWIQTRNGAPIDADSFFHLAIARDYAERPFHYRSGIREGVLGRYPADREPLFHAILAAPIALGASPELAAAITTAAISGAIGLVAFWHARSLLVAVACVYATNTFFLRMLMVRPHGLAVLAVLLGAALLARQRFKTAAFVNALYTLAYSVPVMLALAALLQALTTRRISGLAWIALGSAAGLLIHPQFPNNAIVLWYQGFHVMFNRLAGNTLAVEIPEELEAWSLAALAMDAWLPLGILAASLWHRRLPAWVLLVSSFLLALTFTSIRFVEYFGPVVCLFARQTVDWLVRGVSSAARAIAASLFVLVRPAVAIIAVATQSQDLASEARPWRGAAEWLSRHAAGEAVFNDRWDAFPELRYFGRTFDVFEGLDPVFVAASDPERARIARAVREGDAEPARFVEALPEYRFVVTRTGRLLARWADSAEFAAVYHDASGAIVLARTRRAR